MAKNKVQPLKRQATALQIVKQGVSERMARASGKVAKSRAKGMGKRKGSSFEREVCKKLSLWVSHGKKADLFWRSSMSGGRATVARNAGKLVRQAGDVCAVAPEGHPLIDAWYIECKHYAQIDFSQFVLFGRGKLALWWLRCKCEARSYGKEPMLIAKQNGWPVMVVTRIGGLEQFTVPRVSLTWGDVSLFEDVLLCAWPSCGP